MRRNREPQNFSNAIRIAAFIWGVLSTALPACAASGACACSDGRHLEPGAVSYSRNSDREVITRFEAENNGSSAACIKIWVAETEIHTRGTPYDFYLERTMPRERPINGCGDSDDHFIKRSKTYAFVFNANSTSIREMRSLDSAQNINAGSAGSASKSNTNLWDAIISEDPSNTVRPVERNPKIDSSREFNRTSWVFSRKELQAHYVGIVKDTAENEKLIPLKKTRKVKAGQLGQIEAVDSRHAIVRFYLGSRIAKFARAKNAIRRWYDNVGGPYKETEDDLFTPLRAYIVEVSLDDIIEVNDYLDQAKTERTRPQSL